MTYLLLLLAAVALTAFAIWSGLANIPGTAAYRSGESILFWAQIAILEADAILLGLAIARGNL